MSSSWLSRHDRDALELFVRRCPSARLERRSWALLWIDDGDSVEDVADRLEVSRQSVYNWIERFSARRGEELESRLSDAPRSGRPPTAKGVIDPLIREVIDADPVTLGFALTSWTVPALRHYLRKCHDVAVSEKSIGLALARLNMVWKRPRHDLRRRDPMWRQAKGG